ncbi:MAG: universal stress protein [bacterium]|nr:universal stress protein [bacterium]
MSYARVLVALDLASDSTESVIQRALQVAPDAQVTAVHVVEGSDYADDVAFRPLKGLHDAVMEASARRLEAVCKPAGIERPLLLQGHAANEIRRLVTEQGTDLVVMGAHGRSGRRPLLGSTARAVMHARLCDVLCVHVPEKVRPYQDMLVAVDASEEARFVLAGAAHIAAISGARITLLSVLRPQVRSYAGIDITAFGDELANLARDEQAHVTGYLETLGRDLAANGQRLVRRGHPPTEIHSAAEEISADLIVVGTHGKRGLRAVLGSTASGVLHGARSDVLAVRIPD